ncbi:hypothetical protein BDA96_02G304800 [Sorghum bicolor]|uniref:non-specific serine/threonine protein kinase n=1 Tax=Sorghum bicolor TaxID=4558 RepID=A0A921UU88_SORBI|nr:hypothetical protein BDA96_02G304800 [Sorghum bicolor]
MSWLDISYATTVLLLLASPCATDDRLVPGKPLSPGATIVSDGGSFALGFFSPTNSSSTPDKLYLGIWYNDIPGRLTVVWVANRETPVTASPPASLSLTNASNLVLSGADGRVLWTTTDVAGAGAAAATSNTAAAVLLNTGNLVIRSPNGATLWQSFDHPADSFLPGMKIRVNYKTRAGNRLVSWRSPDDPSPGVFSYGGDPDTFLQIFIWNGTRPIMRSAPWDGEPVTAGLVRLSTTSVIFYQTVVSTQEEIYLTFSVSDGADHTRYVLTDSGELLFQSWNSSSSAWDVLGGSSDPGCNLYGYCGPNGYCDNTESPRSRCKCLDGFEPVAGLEDWNSGRFSQGCRRKEELRRCGEGAGEDRFLALPGMQSPDKFVHVENRTLQECAEECTRNCSCVAYAYANLSSSRNNGDLTRCLVWAGELIDTWKSDTDTLYLRIAGLDAENASIALPPPNNPGHYGQRSGDMRQIRDEDNSMNSLTITTIEGR